MILVCHECGSYEIRFMNAITAGQRVYIFACAIHGTSDAWEPIDAKQMQEIGIQLELGRDFPRRTGTDHG